MGYFYNGRRRGGKEGDGGGEIGWTRGGGGRGGQRETGGQIVDDSSELLVKRGAFKAWKRQMASELRQILIRHTGDQPGGQRRQRFGFVLEILVVVAAQSRGVV